MSVLLNIQERLQETVRMIAELERELLRCPEVIALRMNIKSLEKVKKKLEGELLVEAEAMGREVCRYRILPMRGAVKISDLSSVLGNYQSVISVFYEAGKKGARQRARISSETAARTALDFAYTFAGSIGFVFTVSEGRDLFDESLMSDSINIIAELVRSQQSAEFRAFAERLGPAPIRALYKWADAHVKGHFSADIEWMIGHREHLKLLVQQPEFRKLREVIAETSREQSEEITIRGSLTAADAVKGTFQFLTVGGMKIKGKTGNLINSSHTVELPKRYKARVRKTIKIHFSTDREEVSYRLIELKPL